MTDFGVSHISVARQTDRGSVRFDFRIWAGCHQRVQIRSVGTLDRIAVVLIG